MYYCSHLGLYVEGISLKYKRIDVVPIVYMTQNNFLAAELQH
jgi:hypothetical protein